VEKPIVSVAGLRGIVGVSFTPNVIIPYVAAFADLVGRKRVVVGGDSRESRSWAQAVVEAVLRARGVEVISIGLAPTPTIGMCVRHFKAGGGIAITASHNPAEWNGLKFFQANGEFLTPAQNEKLQALIKKPAASKAGARIGGHQEVTDAIMHHLEVVRGTLGPLLPRKGRRLRIVLDCCNGAASVLAPLVASAFGATPEVIFASPGRPFPRGAEPLPHNLKALCREVKLNKADLGAAFDPDADRLALVDENGRAIGEERTLVLAADTWLSLASQPTPIVVNLSTSRAIDDLAAKHKTTVARTRIGEAHVVAGIRAAKATIGGEGNGGVILPALHSGRDAATALALVLIGMHRHKGTLSEWNASIPDYVMLKEKVELGTISVKKTLARARKLFKDAAEVDDTDGLKFVFKDSWLHLRPSGTEPIMRVFVEAPDAVTAKALLTRAAALLP
jgi:phosphomannomutase